ncbi:IS3 family transposase, partial [Streptomyces sp. NPDC058701]
PGRRNPRDPHRHRGTYGVRRIHAALRGSGHTVNRKRAER